MLYFFHLHECGTATLDEEGRELPTLDAAQTVATTAARDIMCGEVHEGRLCLSCCIVIEDDAHQEVSRVWFHEALQVSGLPH